MKHAAGRDTSAPSPKSAESGAHVSEDEWIRYRIGRLRELRRSVTDAQTIRAINELITEAEERLQALAAVRADASS